MPNKRKNKRRLPSNSGSVSIVRGKRKRARSVWAAQNKKVKKGIRTEFRQVTSNPKLAELVKFSLKGPEGATQKQKIEFLTKHKGVLRSTLKNEFKREGESTKHMANSDEIIHSLGMSRDVPEGMVDALISEVIDVLISRELKQHQTKLTSNLKRYLKQRKIPIEKDVLETSIDLFLGSKDLKRLGQGVDLAKFENIYIRVAKQKRAFRLESARLDNLISRKALKGLNLTPNQTKSMKRWLSKRRDNLAVEFRKKVEGTKMSLDKVEKLVDLQLEELTKEMRAHAIENFGKKEVAKKIAAENVRAAMKTSGTLKQGTREKRMAAYIPKEKKPKEREEQVRKREDAAKMAGKKFDPARYALSEIRKENPETADILQGMFKRGVLSRGSVRKLYESGSLAQRTFVSAVMEHSFIRSFGEKQVNALARGISHIGATGKKIPIARKAFQSKDSKNIFKFLKKADLIETHHGGGSVVYLHRPQSHYGSIGK